MTRLSLALIAGLSLAVGSVAAAQEKSAPPEGFRNLQVLPKDIAKDQLKATMEGFTQQLGVKCTFCHVPDEYWKDDNEHKPIARRMLRLVLDMRAQKAMYFKDDVMEAKINCWSCHRGKGEPDEFVPE